MAEKEQKKDRGSDLGEAAGRKAGREVGGKVGQSAGSAGTAGSGSAGAAGSAGSSAAAGAGGTAAGTAGGTAAGTAGGTAAGVGGGAAAGATAGSVAPGVGTAIGAGVGAVAGRYWKKILVVIIGLPIVGCATFLLIILIPVIVVLLVLNLLFGAGDAGAKNPPGTFGGLKPTYCEQFKTGQCSGVLQQEIIDAANYFGVPPGVLAGVLSIEGPHVMTYDDDTVTKNSAPGAKDTEGIPFSSVSLAIAEQIGCTVSFAGAAGPMQFTYGPAETLLGVANPSNTWAVHAQPAQDAINDGRIVNACNILDSLYAGSHKLKIDSGTAAEVISWSKTEVYAAAAAYLGAPVQADGCYPDYDTTFNYCDQVWQYYLNYSVAPVDDGSHTIPNGWPVGGFISTLWGDTVELGGVVFEAFHPGFDIAASDGISGQPVYASMSGIVSFAGWVGACGGLVDIYNSNSNYTLHLVHLSEAAANQWKTGDFIEAGKLVGSTYEGSLPGCSSGTHLHYEIRLSGTAVDPRPLVPDPNIGSGAPVTVGGGNWVAHN